MESDNEEVNDDKTKDDKDSDEESCCDDSIWLLYKILRDYKNYNNLIFRFYKNLVKKQHFIYTFIYTLYIHLYIFIIYTFIRIYFL